MEKHLIEKNILVTGGSRGIGQSIVKYLLEYNARVGIHFNRESSFPGEILHQYPDKAYAFQADLSRTDQIPVFFKNVIQKMGSLDVLINNAGIAISSSITDTDESWLQSWRKTMDINLNAAGLLCKNMINHSIGSKHPAKIINIASRAAFRGDTEDYLAYAASKAGMVALTRSIARAFGKKEIVAFTIAPGFVRTDMAQQFFDKYGEHVALNQIALPKLTTPDDVAPFVAFLATGLADHATGGTFDINAGSYVH